MKYGLTFLLWCMLAASQSFAQNGASISGRVLEQGTRQSVAEVLVELSGTGRRVTADREGRFTFENLPAGQYSLHASRVGYTHGDAEVQLQSDEQRSITLELQEVSYRLDPVTSTATRMQSRASEVSPSVTVITENELSRYQSQDISDAMQEVPGLFIRPYGAVGDVHTASVRGSTAGQVLVLMDGQRVNNTQSGEVDLTTLPTEGIDRVEIVRGGASALYGADAVGGVINVITRSRGIGEGMTADVRLLSGSFGTREAGLRGDYASGRSFTSLSYRYLKSNGNFTYHPAADSSATRANADFLSHALFGKECWTIDDQRSLSLTGQYWYNESGDPGTISIPNPLARKKNRNGMLDLTFDQETAGLFHSLRVQSFYHNLLFNYEDPRYWSGPLLNDSHNISSGGEVQSGLHFGDWNSLTAGYAYRWDHFSGSSLQGTYQRNLNSAYVVDEVALRPSSVDVIQRVAVVPALRWDRFSDFGAQFSPKIGLVMNAGESWLLSVKANYGRSFRAPTFNDLYWPYDGFTAGNPGVKPERAKDFDAGASLDLPLLAGLGTSFTWFGNTVTDLILWQEGADFVWRPTNVGKAEIHGYEAGASISPWRDLLTIRWNYTHLDARSKSGSPDEYDKKLPDRPDGLHKITVESRHAGLSALVEFLSVGMRYTTTTNNASLPGYHLFNVILGYAWAMPRGTLEVKGEVRNIGDVEYQVMSGYPVPGREFRVSLSFGVGSATGN